MWCMAGWIFNSCKEVINDGQRMKRYLYQHVIISATTYIHGAHIEPVAASSLTTWAFLFSLFSALGHSQLDCPG